VSPPVEREIKLSAAASLVLPDLADLAAGPVGDSGVEQLETVYWDTDRLAAARRGFGLRHRTRRDGGTGTGVWTLKTPGHAEGDRVVRGEHEVTGAGTAPPAGLLDMLPTEVETGELHPVATLRAARRVLTLPGGAGAAVEVMDDTVDVLGGDGSVAERFRELEVEVIGDADDLADRVAARLRAAGAGAPEAGSKYHRALRALGREPESLPDL
jgi:inorganic triphosphatase YgiF